VTAGRKLHEVISNAKSVLAIEFLCNTQALDFQRPLKTTQSLEEVYNVVRRQVETIDNDRIFYKDINNIIKLIDSNEIITAVEKHTGALE
jgi:histidine ammonia-lyase